MTTTTRADLQGPGLAQVGIAVLTLALCPADFVLAGESCDGVSPDTVAPACHLAVGGQSAGKQSAAEVVRYRLHVPRGQVVAVEIDAHGLDLIAELRHPGGDSLTVNAPHGRDGRERFVVEPQTDGTYEIELASVEHTSARGAHRIAARVEHGQMLPRTALELEQEAGSLSAQAVEANTGTADLWREAYQTYLRAAEAWSDAGDAAGQAHAMFAAAWIRYWHLWEWDGAAAQAELASRLYEAAADAGRAANALHLQAASLLEAANERGAGDPSSAALFEEALALLEAAQSAHRSLGNDYDAALVVNNIGLHHYYLGDWARAREYWERAVTTLRKLGEWQGEFNSLANLGVIEFEEGNLVRAVEILNDLLEVFPPGRELAFRADTLDNLGIAQAALGRIDDALASFSKALAIHEQLGSVKGKAQSLNGIAAAYYGAGEFELAREYLMTALPLRREAQDGRGEAWTLRNLGDIARLQHDYATAEELHRAALRLVQSPGDRAPVAIELARDLAAVDRADAAIELLSDQQAALASSGIQVERARVLLELARIREQVGAVDAATQDAHAALDLFRHLGDLAGEAGALLVLSRTAWTKESSQSAIDFAEKSLDRLERLRGRLIDPGLRATFLATQRTHYEWLARILMARGAPGDVERALRVSERTRARLTIDLLGDVIGNVDQGVEPELRNARARLYDRLSELRFRLDRRSAENAADAVEAGGPLVEELRRTETGLRVLNAQMRKRSPRFAALTEPSVLDAREIQGMLDSGESLLQFLLGEERSFAWVVDRNGISGHVLPKRSVLEPLARRVHESMSQHPTNRDRGQLQSGLDALTRLLIVPLASRLQGRRLLIAADGALQYVPFAALGADGDTRLLERFEIAYVPSFSALAAQAQALGQRPRPEFTLAIFADAVFSGADDRLAARLPTGSRTTQAGQTSRNPAELARLPATAVEARRIAELVPENERRVATGFDANRQAVLDGQLQRYRVVHFATHGLVDTRYPTLSALALSQFSADGTPRNGYLQLHEIFGLRLNADLVTLSACDTALGQEILGESLLGLTLGFRYAGAREVVATLWQVPDRASAELMTEFYREFFDNGSSASAALRAAQLAIAQKRQWSDPFYWAAFAVN